MKEQIAGVVCGLKMRDQERSAIRGRPPSAATYAGPICFACPIQDLVVMQVAGLTGFIGSPSVTDKQSQLLRKKHRLIGPPFADLKSLATMCNMGGLSWVYNCNVVLKCFFLDCYDRDISRFYGGVYGSEAFY